MASLLEMLRIASLLGSALLLVAAGCDDDGSDDGSNDAGTGSGTHGHASETGAHDGSETAHDDGGVPPACGELSSICHDLGEEMGGMYAECHDIGHDADLAACEMVYDECIALCTGAGTGGDGSSGGDSTGAGSSGTAG